MKKLRSIRLAMAAVAVLGGAACIVVVNLQAGRTARLEPTGVDRELEAPGAGDAVASAEPPGVARVTRPLPRRDPRPSATEPQVEVVKTDGPADAKTAKVAEPGLNTRKAAQAKGNAQQTTQGNQGARPAKEPIQDPMARVALAYVGADPDAEAYWYEAINDPSLSAQERQDLIEDLNEDGLSDPRNPTLDDLPLILSRIELLETIVWDAMDDVNLDAILEAYKDLVNLANLALGDGEPVR